MTLFAAGRIYISIFIQQILFMSKHGG